MIQFFVPGIARPQGSKRAFKHPHGGQPIMVEMSRKVKPWRQDIRSTAAEACSVPIDAGTPVHVTLGFVFVRPRVHVGARGLTAAGRAKLRPTGRPDIDKLARAVLDALTGVAYADDAQVTALTACKVWGSEPGVHVRITPMARSGEAA